MHTPHYVSPLLYTHPHGYRGHGHGKESNLQQKWISIARYNVGHPDGWVDGTKTTDYLWAAMTDAVRIRITLGNVPEYLAGVMEIYREA
jgi:hypothetical protein